jgi:hypothetical protein
MRINCGGALLAIRLAGAALLFTGLALRLTAVGLRFTTRLGLVYFFLGFTVVLFSGELNL